MCSWPGAAGSVDKTSFDELGTEARSLKCDGSLGDVGDGRWPAESVAVAATEATTSGGLALMVPRPSFRHGVAL